MTPEGALTGIVQICHPTSNGGIELVSGMLMPWNQRGRVKKITELRCRDLIFV
jgi:hypothetical protein